MGTVSIPLTRGKYALIDEDDFPLVSQFRWRTFHDEIPESGYAYTGGHNGVPAISMHRLIIDAPRGMKVDHINGDGLDNRRCNLRLATDFQNSANKRMSKNNSSGYKGVTWHAQIGKWQAQIHVHGCTRYLGVYDDASDAALAYDNAAKQLFGDFARSNYPASDDQ